jgi:hypothetical protein
MLVVDVKGRPWVDRQAGISNISIKLTLGITSHCLHRGFFFAPVTVATLDGLPTDVVEGASDGAADEEGFAQLPVDARDERTMRPDSPDDYAVLKLPIRSPVIIATSRHDFNDFRCFRRDLSL